MRQQGRCTLPVDESHRVLDRLAGLEYVISPEAIRQALTATGRVNSRACRLTHEVMLWLVLAMGLFTHLPIRQVFKQSRRSRAGERTPCRSALCLARQRLGVEPVQALFQQVVHPLATHDTPGAFYRGLRRMGIDGTILDAPDSEANAAAFARSSGGRGGGAFPQVRKVSLVELGTHVEVAFSVGGWQDDERTLARPLWDRIPSDALLYEDRGFFSYSDWKILDSRGVKLLVRALGQLVLEPILRLSDGSYFAKLYPTHRCRTQDQRGVLVRVIAYTLDDSQRTGHGELHRLVTNLLDPAESPAEELIVEYHQRWEHELTFDEQKTHQDPRRAEKPAHLRSETPDGVRQELWALSLAHFVTRSLMLQAAQPLGLDVDRLSLTGCFRILQCRLSECDASVPGPRASWLRRLLTEMEDELQPPRRNRINPRVIKRKMSHWPKKQLAHKRAPPLAKTFTQSIVLII